MTTKQAQELITKLQESINEANGNNINMDCITSDAIDALNYGLFGLDLANHYLDTVIQLAGDRGLDFRYDTSAEELIMSRANKLAQKASDVGLLLITINKAVNMIDDLTEGSRQ